MEIKTETNRPDSTSQDFQAMIEYWETVQNVVDGRGAVVRGAEKYLPKFPNETKKDYDFRLQTAKFTNVYRDIVENLAQKPFAHELTLADDESPEQIKALVEDIDGRGNHLHVFAQDTFFNGINKAIDWILVDHSRSPGLRTIAEEREAGARPYWVHIPAEAVIWIESEIIAGREQLVKVKILEEKGRVKTFIRESGVVTWTVEVQSGVAWTVEDEGTLTIDEIPMVPFVTGRRRGKNWQFNPPMRDAIDLQIELYQQETALKHIKALTCFPMLAGNGVEPERDESGNAKPVPVGPQAVLYAPPNGDGQHGEWKWIITEAETLKFLAEDVKDTIKELRELGRQPLTAQSGNLTVITTSVAAAKGNSAVQSWAMLLKDALENAFRITAKWLNREGDAPEVRVFTDFGVEDQDEKTPEHLLKAREQGDLSQVTVWEEFKRRGILGPEFTADRELERLFEELPGEGDL
jgi:hypothetical protein